MTYVQSTSTMCAYTDFLFFVICKADKIRLRSLEEELTGCSGLNRCNGCAGKPFHRRWFIVDEERIPGSVTTGGLSEAT